MQNRKNNKRALIVSALSLLLCVSMLVGSTMAWFTDNASTGVNTIQAGTLDIDLLDKDGNSLDGKTIGFADKDNNSLWEPGCRYTLQEIKLINNGKLHAKYRLSINAVIGDVDLSKVIDVYEGETKLGTLDQFLNQTEGVKEGTIAPGETLSFGTLTLVMQTTAGNEYQGKSIENIAITVQATQAAVESDSFGSDYDENAEFDKNVWDNSAPDVWDGTAGTLPEADADGAIVISTAEEFAAFAAAVNGGDTYEGKTVKLNTNIDLNNQAWTSISSFAGTLDGQRHIISNLKDAALFTTVSATGVVQNLKIENASATFDTRKSIGFLAMTLEGKAENCTVTDASITNTAYLNYAGGMFAEAKNNAVIDNCSVNGVTIVASNATDAGQHVGGLIGSTVGTVDACVTITNSSASNVTIEVGKKAKRFGGFIGYSNNTTIDNCSVSNVDITVDDYYYRTAGFIAEATNGTVIKNCAVNGATIDVTKVTSGGAVGGFASSVLIVSDDRTITFENCTVSGLSLTLNADNTSGAGGFIGATGSYATAIKNCSVEGKITTTAEAIAAGAVNALVGSGTPTVEGNTANVTIQ